jgi:hypothetical protein
MHPLPYREMSLEQCIYVNSYFHKTIYFSQKTTLSKSLSDGETGYRSNDIGGGTLVPTNKYPSKINLTVLRRIFFHFRC